MRILEIRVNFTFKKFYLESVCFRVGFSSEGFRRFFGFFVFVSLERLLE